MCDCTLVSVSRGLVTAMKYGYTVVLQLNCYTEVIVTDSISSKTCTWILLVNPFLPL